ncbi:MAG: glycosyltransferase, partial [Patescibacteria group bacterium]
MERKTKIFYLITKSNFGGAQKYVYDLATNLPSDQYEVKVIFGEGGELKQKLETAGVETLKIENLSRDIKLADEFKVLKQLIKLFRREKPDVIHLNSSKIGGLGALAGRLAGVPKIIFTVHGWAFNENRSFFSRLAIHFSYWLTILLCHQTIAVSAKTKDQIGHLPWLKNKITVIYNGLTLVDFLERQETRKYLLGKMAVRSIGQTLSLLEERLIIGTISELH